MTRQHLTTAATVLGVLLLAGPTAAGQASTLDASEASAFMGTWVIAEEAPRGGTFDQTLTVHDEDGKVAARYGAFSVNDTKDISKDGDNLILTFDGSGRGGGPVISTSFFGRGDLIVTLTPDGETLNASINVGACHWHTLLLRRLLGWSPCHSRRATVREL